MFGRTNIRPVKNGLKKLLRHKNEASMGCVRETTRIKMKAARVTNKVSMGCVRETPYIKKQASTGCVRETPFSNDRSARLVFASMLVQEQ